MLESSHAWRDFLRSDIKNHGNNFDGVPRIGTVPPSLEQTVLDDASALAAGALTRAQSRHIESLPSPALRIALRRSLELRKATGDSFLAAGSMQRIRWAQGVVGGLPASTYSSDAVVDVVAAARHLVGLSQEMEGKSRDALALHTASLFRPAARNFTAGAPGIELGMDDPRVALKETGPRDGPQ